jgi:hypothetical protein
VAIIAFALVFGLVTVSFVSQLSGLAAACGAGPYSGLECNSTVLGIATFGLLAVTVLAFVIGLGMAIVRIIQKRFTFFWPLGALILMIVSFYFFTWLASQTVPAA